MAEGFSVLRREIDAQRDNPAGTTMSQVASLAGRTTEMMVEENLDWRIVVLDPPHAAG